MFAAPVNSNESNLSGGGGGDDEQKRSRNRTQRNRNESKKQSVIQTLRNLPPVNQYEDSTNELADFKPIDPPNSVGVDQTRYREHEKEGFEALSPSQPNSYSSSFMNIDDQDDINNNANGSDSFALSSDSVLKKINYVIKLLEEQQDVKTSNVAEEVILYFFLGIFIIFIVDSFVRMGKYTR